MVLVFLVCKFCDMCIFSRVGYDYFLFVLVVRVGFWLFIVCILVFVILDLVWVVR